MSHTETDFAHRTSTSSPIQGFWLSLGENCLADDILKRHGLKTGSTPFSSVRSNIEYAIEADRTDFTGLLDPSNLSAVTNRYEQLVVRSALYGCETGWYDPSVAEGFEFTHHQVMTNVAHRESFQRKIQRWIDLRRSGRAGSFLYCHRLSGVDSVSYIQAKLEEFLCSFNRDGAEAKVVFMHQEIVDDHNRGVDVYEDAAGVRRVRFRTISAWGGDNLWAKSDDDLIETMFGTLKNQ